MFIQIRAFKEGDEDELRSLFFNSIHNACKKDYSPQQLAAWAPEQYDESQWHERIRKINPFIAHNGQQIVGYADVQSDGYIDHFFCHYQFQGKGVAKALMSTLMNIAQKKQLPRLHAQVSKTAKPFFEYIGFQVINPQQVEVRGEMLTNYVMEFRLW